MTAFGFDQLPEALATVCTELVQGGATGQKDPLEPAAGNDANNITDGQSHTGSIVNTTAVA